MSGKYKFESESIDTDDGSRRNLDYGAFELGSPVRSGPDADVYEVSATVDGESQTVEVRRPRLQGRMAPAAEAYLDAVESWATVDDGEFVLGLVDWGAAEDGPWVATERVEGATLRERIDDGLDAETAVGIAERCARGLQGVHEGLVYHHALTPARVLVDGDDRPHVADVATGAALDGGAGGEGALAPAYAAPEQFDPDSRHGPDQRTDVYRLGAVLYEALTGTTPYEGSPSEVVEAATDPDRTPTPPSEYGDVPEGTDEVLGKALATAPADRYWTADEFGRALAELIGEGDRYRSGTDSWPQDGAVPENTHRVIDDGPRGEVEIEWELDEHDDHTTTLQTDAGGLDEGRRRVFTVGDGKLFTTISYVEDHDEHDEDYAPRYLAAVDDETRDLVWLTEFEESPHDYGLDRKPVYDDGLLFAPIHDEIRAFDADTGEEVWATELPEANGLAPDQESGAVGSDPTVADGTLYVGSRFSSVVAIDTESGDVVWTADTEGPVEATPAVADGTVYVRDAEWTLHAFDAEDGAQQWRDGETLDNEEDWQYPAPVAAHGRVYVANRRRVYAFDAESADHLWTFFAGLDRIEGFYKTPAVGGGRLFVPSQDGDLFALDADTGEEVWYHDGVEELSSPAVGNGTVYVSDKEPVNIEDGYMRALDADTGQVRWEIETGVLEDFLVADRNVYALDNKSIGEDRSPLVKFTER